mgnify:CR=1 FL=1
MDDVRRWQPAPLDMLAELHTCRWAKGHPAPEFVAWLWTWRQADSGRAPSIRDVANYSARGKTWAARIRADALAHHSAWDAGEGSRYQTGQRRDSGGTAAGQQKPTKSTDSNTARDSGGTAAGQRRDDRARSSSTTTNHRPYTLQKEPHLEPDPKPEPLWTQMGLPKPGRGVTRSHLTAPVLEVWRHWWNTCHNTDRRGVVKPRTIGKGPVRAIRAALGHGYSVEELQAITRYAFEAPDGSPHVDWWRSKPHFLNPATIMGKELDRNHGAAQLWASGDMAAPTPTTGGQIAYLQSMLGRNNGKPGLSDQGHHAATGSQPQERPADGGAHGSNGAALGDAPW